jgi:hypothetical protein
MRTAATRRMASEDQEDEPVGASGQRRRRMIASFTIRVASLMVETAKNSGEA